MPVFHSRYKAFDHRKTEFFPHCIAHDKQGVSKTTSVNGDTIKMFATWKKCTAHTYNNVNNYKCSKCGYTVTKETLRKTGNTWYYYKNGVLNKSNTLVYYNGKWRHVNGGKWVKDTAIVSYNGSKFFIKNGVKYEYTGYVTFNGKTYKLKNGKIV